MGTATKTNRKPAKRGRGKDEDGRMKDEGGRMKATGEAAVPEAIDFDAFAEVVDLLDDLLEVRSDVKCPSGTDLAVFVHNQGDIRDRAEALLVMTPIARRVYERQAAARRA